jgi:hypothetical protein
MFLSTVDSFYSLHYPDLTLPDVYYGYLREAFKRNARDLGKTSDTYCAAHHTTTKIFENYKMTLD